MSTEKRFVLFMVLSVLLVVGAPMLMERFGLIARPQPQVAQEEPEAEPDAPKGKDQAKADDPKAKGAKPAFVAAKDGGQPKPRDEDKPKDEPRKPDVPEVGPDKLVLGSLADKTGRGYRLQVYLDQRGAGVLALASAMHEAEIVEGLPRNRPLELIQPSAVLDAPPSFALNLSSLGSPSDPDGGVRLDDRLWEVVADSKGRFVRSLIEKKVEVGQEVTFRTKAGSPELIITKTFRLRKGADGLEMVLNFESPEVARKVVYRLEGPHSIPIEGEWYTGTFREVFFGMAQGKAATVQTLTAADIVKAKDEPERIMTLPLSYAGVENQYFALLIEPEPTPTPETRWDAESIPIVVHEDDENKAKSDVSFEMTSRPIAVEPNAAVTHAYRIFAGPKTTVALAPYRATELATYRKGWQLWVIGPTATMLAQWVIAPLLDRIYGLTHQIAALVGGQRGSYGIAIILLTLLVRLALFPLSRKQAISAKKMQELQPQMVGIREKFKDDKEAQTRETWALYKQYKVNPFGGCLLALIQLPIFIGLWQALNNSVALRHAPFLWIKNLAAPDMLFHFPVELPFLGHYFNILPFLVVALMLVQTKLFSPPPTTDEARMQQQMMKVMMVFMAFMFYKVPSGLGIYFITSSTWSICERLLLGKVIPSAASLPPATDEDDRKRPGPGGNGRGPGGNGRPAPHDPQPGKSGWFGDFRDKIRAKVDQIMDEAAQDKTVRNDRDSDRDRDRDRGKGKPRTRPGRRR